MTRSLIAACCGILCFDTAILAASLFNAEMYIFAFAALHAPLFWGWATIKIGTSKWTPNSTTS